MEEAEDGTNVPTYDQDAELFQKFLLEHTILVPDEENDSDDDDMQQVPTDTGNRRRVPCYHDHLQRIKDRRYYDDTRTFVVEVPLGQLPEVLAQRAAANTLRYHQIFCKVLDKVLESMNHQEQAPPGDTMDFFYEQRRHAVQQQQQQANPIGGVQEEEETNQRRDAIQDLPPQLMRRYELRILPIGRRGTHPPFDRQVITLEAPPVALSLRQVRARSLGKLVTITGLIVRSSDVKPVCIVATYSCDRCGAEIYQVTEFQREFMPVTKCPACKHTKSETLYLQTRGSKFQKYQELKLQELPNQVPMGQVPRSCTILCKNELCRAAVPGDILTVDGIFLPQRLAESGFKALKAGLIATTYLEAQNIVLYKKSFDSIETQDEKAVMEVATGADPIGRLASSIAPEIFGHDDIKRSLLVQLVGGVTRKLPDGMRIRGDVNILLMGDPGVAKSQLLKHVSSIAPRGVYTTGKGSSGVGLTAAVTKDMTTSEMSLEGGALVLADRGICCIDEFDKMEESDRTAIHEVMEQQTVSIAKAGIVATLNARTSVLAAANPLYGRYNRSKSLSENINLPNSLLSRFDLLFLIVDKPDIDRDTALARHVTLVHQNEGLEKKDDDDDEEAAAGNVVTPKVLREYIARARQHQPVVPPEVAPYIVEAYVSLRRNDDRHDQTVMTARQLLSILRLSQALARLRFSDFVAREDVDEAIRLTNSSKSSLNDKDETKRTEDVMSRVFHILRDAATGKSEVEVQLAQAMVLRKGFTVQQMQSCIEEYEALQVIQVNQARTHIYFIGGLA